MLDRQRTNSAVLLACAVIMALAATACQSGSGGSAQQRSDSTLVIALPGEPDNLNPIFGSIYSGNQRRIFNGLLSYDQNLSQVPDLAAEMPKISPDGKTVTVRLRKDVRFHDGKPLTARDVVFTYRSILDPQVASPRRYLLDSVRKIEALDRYTVRFSLNRADPAFPHKLHIGIVPRHRLAGKDLNTAAFNENPVGTGPYMFEQWREGERLVLAANPDYFEEPANIPRVVFAFVESENAGRPCSRAAASMQPDSSRSSLPASARARPTG